MSRTPESLLEAVRHAGVTDKRVLAAIRATPRAAFVPSEHIEFAYYDEPVPIPHGQVTTQPSLVAAMVEALSLTGRENVLEVGTGHGFQTALLACLAADVVSIERWPDLAETARGNLARHGVRNVRVLVGDGTLGAPRWSPYDAIIVSAAFPEVPAPLTDQLRTGGRLVQPIGPGGAEEVTLFARTERSLRRQGILTGAYFVPLYGKHGFPAS
ncbi:protein-L-isoaspartate O-methyltransferase [Longimycelium tulufanense]|uniref:Protein-L-isoaspartate O-methyltransferase n=1 Tax=Longimycelium tulufanense TaxID=907463 RepID=A0A8J3FSE2_9PSEU|nr:protein-L-isoaspartate(D-aspartate) O-methyltransferase [Longimycelium tulufanense]GGM37048.1 protein-L-isoaspartate O-methyltransferase [Longimycelium tulufanense]